MKVTTINIAEAKAKFSSYARRVQRGERIILCSHNKPFAEIRPLRLTSAGRRPIGLGKAEIHVPDGFNDPDPAIESLFSGGP
jgi:prevent-host-death family protein